MRRACDAADAGPMTAGPAARPFDCGLNRSGATTTLAFELPLCGNSDGKKCRLLQTRFLPLGALPNLVLGKNHRLHGSAFLGVIGAETMFTLRAGRKSVLLRNRVAPCPSRTTFPPTTAENSQSSVSRLP